MQIRLVEEQDHLQLTRLFNAHTSVLQPGWGLRWPTLRRYTECSADPEESAMTLVAHDGHTLCAASRVRRWVDEHDGPEAEIVWLLGVSDRSDAALLLLNQLLDDLSGIAPTNVLLAQELYVPVYNGITDAWPHLRSVVLEAGFSPLPQLEEAAYAGPLRWDEPGGLPVPGLTLHRDLGEFGTRFKAILDGRAISQCEICFPFGEFEDVPAMRGWVEVSEVRTLPEWRSRGIGRWVMQSAVNWAVEGSFTRAILTVGRSEEEAGAGRFYERLGWTPVGRMEKGWKRWSETSEGRPSE